MPHLSNTPRPMLLECVYVLTRQRLEEHPAAPGVTYIVPRVCSCSEKCRSEVLAYTQPTHGNLAQDSQSGVTKTLSSKGPPPGSSAWGPSPEEYLRNPGPADSGGVSMVIAPRARGKMRRSLTFSLVGRQRATGQGKDKTFYWALGRRSYHDRHTWQKEFVLGGPL